MIRVETVSEPEGLLARTDAWRALLREAPGASVFDTPEWVLAWWRAFGAKSRPRFLFLYDGTALRGVAPLFVHRGALRDRWCLAPGTVAGAEPHSYRANVVCSGPPEPLLEAMLLHLGAEHGFRLALHNALGASPAIRALPEVALGLGLRSAVVPALPSPVLRIEGTWEGYLRGHSKNLAKQVHKKLRHFAAAGPSSFVVASSSDAWEGALRDATLVESRSWKESIDGSLSGNPRLWQLHRDFARGAAEAGNLRLYVLYLGDLPIAFVYGVVWGDEYYAFKTSYDEAYAELSPGTVIFDRVFRDAFEAGLCAVDLGAGGGARWKEEFSNEVREHVDVCVYTPSMVACHLCAAFRTRWKPGIRRAMPRLVAWRKTMQARQRSHRRR